MSPLSPMMRRRRAHPEFPLTRHTVGNAVVVCREREMTQQARELAMSVAADSEHEMVVVDLPINMPISAWDTVAELLPRRRRGVRLVLGGRSREATALAGQWLSERTGRTVVAPDGAVFPGVGGTLFVHAGKNSGWVRFRPGRAPEWEAKRFPRPSWDSRVVDPWPTSAVGMAEPIPGGVWIHTASHDAASRGHWSRLVRGTPCQPDVLTAVLGCPGMPPLSLDDVARFWRRLDEQSREKVRFVQYGPVRLPEGETLGQALADLLDARVACYTGMPVGRPESPDVYTMCADGELGWLSFAREVGYLPRSHSGHDGAPVLLSHRVPVPGVERIGQTVYWYTPDAVLEVVQSGLWMRPPQDAQNAAAVRAEPGNADFAVLAFDAADEKRAARMRALAQDVLARLDPATRVRCRLVPASELGRQAVRVAGPAHGEVESDPARTSAQDTVKLAPVAPAPATGAVGTASATVDGATALATEPPVAAGPAAASSVVMESPVAAEPPVAAAPPVATEPPAAPAPPAATASPAATEPPPAAESPVVDASPSAPPPPISSTSPVVAEPPATGAATADGGAATATAADFATSFQAPPAPDPSPAPAPTEPERPASMGIRLEGGPESEVDETPREEPATPAPEPDPVPEAAAPPETGTAPPEAPAASARLQPTPKPSAAALLPEGGLSEERDWLRRTLSREFDAMSHSTSRILSEHPGFQGTDARASGEVLADAVAVRLYLPSRGAAIDQALRGAQNGPHVPFARCVVSGLSRLPSHRGATVFAASPTEQQWALYRRRTLVTEWGFTHALTEPSADQRGDVDVLVWSMTARRTRLLEPDGDDRVDNRVVFVPGTSFKVLEVTEPGAERGRILLRELAESELDDEGGVHARESLDELAITSLQRCVERWSGAEPRGAVGDSARQRFGALPGLV